MLSLGIIPTLRSPAKPPLLTTFTFVAVLAVSLVAFVSLGLWLTAAGLGVQVVLWGAVMAQTLAARPDPRAALSTPTVTTPELGFDEFAPPE